MQVPALLPDDRVSAAYLELRARVVMLLRSLAVDAGGTTVPHCPEWTVQNLAAHLFGVPDDIVNGRMEGVASDVWTQAQVDRSRHRTVGAIADALEALAPRFDPLLPHFPAMSRSQMTMDAVTHEHDLRHAVGQPGARDSLAVRAALGWLGVWAEGRVPGSYAQLFAAGLSDFDLLRCLTGRRSIAQAEALGLSADVLRKVQANSPLRAPTNDVME